MTKLMDLKKVDLIEDKMIFRIPLQETEEFFYDNQIYFENQQNLGNFLKVFRINKKTYQILPDSVKKQVLLAGKNEMISKKDSLYIVEGDNKLNFFIENEDNYINPIKALGLDNPELFPGLIKIGSGVSEGRLRYFSSFNGKNKNNFTSGMFFTVPMFYEKSLIFEVGSYRMVCSNGLVDRINCTQLRIPFSKLNVSFFPPMFNAMKEGMAGTYLDFSEKYNKNLKEIVIKDYKAVNILKNLIQEKKLSKDVGTASLKHIDLLKNREVIPPNSVEKMENGLDFINLLTFYAHEVKHTLSARANEENKIFIVGRELIEKEKKCEAKFDKKLELVSLVKEYI